MTTQAQELVTTFNSRFPVGADVLVRKVSLEGFPYTSYQVRYPAYVSNSGEPVAFFEGITGYFSISPEFVRYETQEGGKEL